MTWAVFGGVASLIATATAVFGVIVSYRAQERERRRTAEEERRQRQIELATARDAGYAAGAADVRRELQPQVDLRTSERDDARRDSVNNHHALRDSRARVQRLEEEIRRMITQRRNGNGGGT